MDFLVIATILLVLATIYYAVQTRKTVKEMDEANKMHFFPIIAIDVGICGGLSENDSCYYFPEAVIKNIGRGLAQRPRIIFPFNEPIEIKDLSANEQYIKSLKIERVDEILKLPDRDRNARVEFFDILNRKIVTQAYIKKVQSQNYVAFETNNWSVKSS